MYMNKYPLDAIEMLLLLATGVLGLIALIDDLWLAPRRRLRSQPVPTPVGVRIIQVAFLVLLVRLVVNMVRSGALDFSFVLVAGAALCGFIWLLDKFVLRPVRLTLARQNGKPESEADILPTTTEYAISFFPVIAVVLVIRSFLIEPFRIPSDSMMPTLLDGDFIFVNKYAYGLRLPVANTKVVSVGEPKRGDVIVFRLPSDPSINYIKRLVGLPGDHVVVSDNQVIINETPMKLTWDGFYTESANYEKARLGQEDLGTKQHVIMLARRPGSDYAGTDCDIVVPPGHYFFMGDNRNNSQDSRFSQVGFVPDENIVGRAVRIWM